jgi:pimeloyl-ACP methyl ester carboxylesterase
VPTAHLNGIDVYYERSGDGPPLLFLNGSGTTLASTGLLLGPFRERFDLLAHDQRGLGATSIPPGPYSMADYAADAIALLDHVGWDRCRVVGISFGGMVAQELAVTTPERIERLALLCTSPGGAGGASYPLHELADLSQEDRAALGATLLDTRFTPAWLAEHDGDRGLAEMMAARSATPKDPEVLRGEREQLEARRHHDVHDRLERITCPTLVAAGRYDGIAPPANAEAIAARVPDADLRLYEGGHAFFAQDGRALPEVLDFLAA